MNAKTTTEKNNNVDKQDYRRHQFGGSFGGQMIKDKLHYFVAAERTNQDTFQAVSTRGLFPDQDGIYATPYRETLLNVKVTANLDSSNYVSVRYGRNQNSQPYGAAANRAPSAWGESTNEFNSINVNYNRVIGSSKLGAGARPLWRRLPRGDAAPLRARGERTARPTRASGLRHQAMTGRRRDTRRSHRRPRGARPG